MGVGLATSPRLDRIHLAEREACPGQLKWAPLIQWKSGLKRPVDRSRHHEHSGAPHGAAALLSLHMTLDSMPDAHRLSA